MLKWSEMRLTIFFIFIFLISIFLAGCLNDEVGNQSNSSEFNQTGMQVTKKELDAVEKLNKTPYDYLKPYNGFEYDNIDIKVRGEKITVTATVEGMEGEDIYVFINESNNLILNSYSLEALPASLKSEAISIALSNEEIYSNANDEPTVRRILPHTSEKYYQPKELFSITWKGEKVVSALVDLDSGEVVRVYFSQ